MDSEDNVVSLTISNVEHSDAGLYRCELYNPHGRAETTGALIVDGNYKSDSYNKT